MHQEGRPLSRQVLEHASADCDLDSAEGRARLLVQAIPLIAQFPGGSTEGPDCRRPGPDGPRRSRMRLLAAASRHHQPSAPAARPDHSELVAPHTHHDGRPTAFDHDEAPRQDQWTTSHIPRPSSPTAAAALGRRRTPSRVRPLHPAQPARRRDGQPWKPWEVAVALRWQSRAARGAKARCHRPPHRSTASSVGTDLDSDFWGEGRPGRRRTCCATKLSPTASSSVGGPDCAPSTALEPRRTDAPNDELPDDAGYHAEADTLQSPGPPYRLIFMNYPDLIRAHVTSSDQPDSSPRNWWP